MSKYITNRESPPLTFGSLMVGDYFVDSEETLSARVYVVTDEKEPGGRTFACVVATELPTDCRGLLVPLRPENPVRRLEIVTEPKWKLV